MFKRALQAHGIAVEGEAAARDARVRADDRFDPAHAVELANVTSATLAEIAHATNKESINLNAELILRITDDGRGFDALRSFPGHLGLQSMRERMAGVGGSLHIQSALGRGTSIEARLRLSAGSEHPLHSR